MSIVLYYIACNMLSVHLPLTYWHWYVDTVYYVCICCRYTGGIFVQKLLICIKGTLAILTVWLNFLSRPTCLQNCVGLYFA